MYLVGLELQYIAEHHENLQHIMVFFNVTGSIAGLNLEAKISSWSENEERMVVSCGSMASLPAPLPARSVVGKREIKVQHSHFELKLPTIPSASLEGSEPVQTTLFDAAALKRYSPTSFICSSCSLPLVQSTRVTEYTDLPSEHWEELVDAWMCHTDQKLHEHVVKHASKGFWPTDGQAFVGGSYIMFEGGAVVEDNLRLVEKTKVSVQSS
jgi:ubiquitin-protein ligase E3 D